MMKSQHAQTSWDQQQQTGESTNSSLESSIENDQDRMDEERILRTIANLLTNGALLGTTRHSGNSFVEENDISLGKNTPGRRSTRRRQTPLPGSGCVDNWRQPTTPEREVPFSPDQSPEIISPPTITMGPTTSDCSAPSLVAISPNPDFDFDDEYSQQYGGNETGEFVPKNEHDRRSQSWAKQKLAAAIFSHPQPLCNFCQEAYQAATERMLNDAFTDDDSLTEDANGLSIHNNSFDGTLSHNVKIPRCVVNTNMILTFSWDTLNALQEMTLDVSFATVTITVRTLDASARVVIYIWGTVTRFNPFVWVNEIITRPFNMMGMTTEVVVSGIQSVATGVGSASSIALNRLSAKTPLSTGAVRSPAKSKKIINHKLLRKLNNLNSTAPVVSYTELEDNDGGLSKHAKSKVQRMMHYDVSLRPFLATVKSQKLVKKESSGNLPYHHDTDKNSQSSSPIDGPFMCTPQSFPATPASRAHVMKRGSRFADDVIFLARDQLRVHDGLESENETTREMAQALTQGNRLAVFDADDASAGIEFSCGQHVATKVGNLLYCTTRSMVPILRNCFVYFEMAILGHPGGMLQTGMTSLSFGLSTKEMPSTSLVGAWKGSVGLCTTGQILISGQWCGSVPDASISPFGDRATVGCLVCLDDSSAFETWEGVMITATVTFNINGRIVSHHLPTNAPISTADNQELSQGQNTQAGPILPSFTLPLLVPAEEELYPTLTLHSPGTSVMCRFSAGDVRTRSSRDAIGAPKHVAVYAVDGSTVFNDEEM